MNKVACPWQTDVSLAPYTSYAVGGSAEYFYRPKDLHDLSKFLKNFNAQTFSGFTGSSAFAEDDVERESLCSALKLSAAPFSSSSAKAEDPVDNDARSIAITFLGLGSNVLIRDGGIKGLVIVTTNALKQMTWVDDNLVRAEAGVTCAKFAKLTARQGKVGAGFMAGVPGTIGGAIAMNAGCYGGDTWSILTAVETIDRFGEIRTRPIDDFKVAYREVLKPADEYFVAGHFQLPDGDVASLQADIKAWLRKRNETQPIGLRSCGSVFRNPEGDHAARLLQACGLKGYHIGDACFSEKHANFIINQGKAKASDIESLIKHGQQQVFEKFNIKLKPEVHILGEFADD